mmetsp:Transcript_2274/g.5144  ORF Transcript_2274/g.5144 Transcript_2274/m.5144 type:complete len:232 (-) Transcript_2274:76-771(-)
MVVATTPTPTWEMAWEASWSCQVDSCCRRRTRRWCGVDRVRTGSSSSSSRMSRGGSSTSSSLTRLQELRTSTLASRSFSRTDGRRTARWLCRLRRKWLSRTCERSSAFATRCPFPFSALSRTCRGSSLPWQPRSSRQPPRVSPCLWIRATGAMSRSRFSRRCLRIWHGTSRCLSACCHPATMATVLRAWRRSTASTSSARYLSTLPWLTPRRGDASRAQLEEVLAHAPLVR